MNIEKRYLEVMANYYARQRLKKGVGMVYIIGFAFLLTGGMIHLSGNLLGIAIMVVAVGLLVLVAIKQTKQTIVISKEFTDYYERTGELPPLPEEKKPEKETV